MLSRLTFCIFTAISALQCTDWNGNIIKNGEKFSPNKNDPCHQCTCQDGQTTMCKSVSCSPPDTCVNPVPVLDECCGFTCQDKPVLHEEGVTPNMTGPGDTGIENSGKAVTGYGMISGQ